MLLEMLSYSVKAASSGDVAMASFPVRKKTSLSQKRCMVELELQLNITWQPISHIQIPSMITVHSTTCHVIKRTSIMSQIRSITHLWLWESAPEPHIKIVTSIILDFDQLLSSLHFRTYLNQTCSNYEERICDILKMLKDTHSRWWFKKTDAVSLVMLIQGSVLFDTKMLSTCCWDKLCACC